MLSRDVALSEGIVALALLIMLQYLVTWSFVRSKAIGRLVKSDPLLLFYRGAYLHNQVRVARIVEHEVMAAIRQQDIASLNHVEAVVLETDGTFAVVS